ncbi:hypothetical protein CFP56_035409 [Quercus suber]|uniref:DUF223 domain-containing protein n=1 Tax=Quercus suber TaxID=58331 RepID=A0AAW0J9J5_QUESU
MSYNLIKQLSDKNENWKVRVRLSRMWEAVNRKNLELINLDIVLIDEQDDTIHTTIQKNNVKKFQAQLREGQLYSLSNFRVNTYKEKDSYRPISKEKKINFLRTTVIEELKEAEVTISQHKFEFVDYQTIVDRFNNSKQLTDIIGKIVGVGPLENVHVQGSTVPMRNIDIMNPENVEKTEIEGIPLQFEQEISVEKRITQNRRTIKQITSLEWTSDDQLKLSKCSQPFSQWYQLDERYIPVEFKILFHLLQLQGLLCRTSSKREEDGSRTEFQIISPSCLTLPERNSISIELPSNWYKSKWIGFPIFASLPYHAYWGDVIKARVIALNHWAFELFTAFFFDRQPFTNFINLRQDCCLLYLSRDEWFATVGNGKCSQIKVTFTIDVFSCGVTLLYEQDVDEFNQTNALCLIQRLGEKSIYKLSGNDLLNHPSH